MVHADAHDRKEAMRVKKSSGSFNQLQHPVETLDKQRDGEYRETLSAEVKPFATFQANKEKFIQLSQQRKTKKKST